MAKGTITEGDGWDWSRLLHATVVKAAAHGRHPFEGFLLPQLEVLGKFAGGGGAAQALVQLISRLGAAVANGRGRPGTLGARPLGYPGRPQASRHADDRLG
jgi:hypothetical protein